MMLLNFLSSSSSLRRSSLVSASAVLILALSGVPSSLWILSSILRNSSCFLASALASLMTSLVRALVRRVLAVVGCVCVACSLVSGFGAGGVGAFLLFGSVVLPMLLITACVKALCSLPRRVTCWLIKRICPCNAEYQKGAGSLRWSCVSSVLIRGCFRS